MRLVAPFGFYGWGNIGDEATLQGFARLLARYDPSASAWVASRDPEHTARAEPAFHYFKATDPSLRRWWANRRAQGAVIVGGTPIMDIHGTWPLDEVAPLVARHADRGTPVAFVGIGTERLEREESRATIARELAPRVRHWSVRSEHDRQRLLTCGVDEQRVTVAADLAWTLEASLVEPRDETPACLVADPGEALVGVNLTNERFVSERAPRFFVAIAGFLDRLVEKFTARVVFFCNEVREGDSFDKAASALVMSHMRHRGRAAILSNEYRTPPQMMKLIGKCHLAVGMRYHFCVFAALQGVPFVAIKRSDKVDDLCTDLSWGFGVGLDEIESSRLDVFAAQLLEDPGGAAATLGERVTLMRARVWQNNAALDALGLSRGDDL
jgi:polysaccharide pyruvyl transferase WcaK-like protein